MPFVSATQKVNCASYWLEACQLSEFINIKVIRVFSATAVKEFIERNNDIHTVHLVSKIIIAFHILEKIKLFSVIIITFVTVCVGVFIYL